MGWMKFGTKDMRFRIKCGMKDMEEIVEKIKVLELEDMRVEMLRRLIS
jgi:hypothetical protein